VIRLTPRGPKKATYRRDRAAVMVAKIATGEIEDAKSEKNLHAAALGTFRYSSAAPTARLAARLASASYVSAICSITKRPPSSVS
jgi:hypothetical protein